MKRNLFLLGFFVLFACRTVPPGSESPVRWPHLPERALFRGDITLQTQTAVHRGDFLLRYDPDSVAFLAKGILGFSRSFHGPITSAPPELQALLSLIHPSFCGTHQICTPAGTLSVHGSPLPTRLEIPGRLRIRILRWTREEGYDLPMEWLFEGEEGSGKIRVTDYRVGD